MSLYGYEDYSWQGQHLGSKIGETLKSTSHHHFSQWTRENFWWLYMVTWYTNHFQTHPCSAINMDWPEVFWCAWGAECRRKSGSCWVVFKMIFFKPHGASEPSACLMCVWKYLNMWYARWSKHQISGSNFQTNPYISIVIRRESYLHSLHSNEWLVVWNMALMFPYIGDNPSQLTFIFVRRVETTNQLTMA